MGHAGGQQSRLLLVRWCQRLLVEVYTASEILETHINCGQDLQEDEGFLYSVSCLNRRTGSTLKRGEIGGPLKGAV